MKYIFSILFLYVSIIHFVIRGILIEFSTARGDYALSYFRKYKTEVGYFAWESKLVFVVYALPYASILISAELFPKLVFCALAFVVSVLRSIEHIHPKFMD